eukprot:12584924-Alexandrium_andersonii.AAC.1
MGIGHHRFRLFGEGRGRSAPPAAAVCSTPATFSMPAAFSRLAKEASRPCRGSTGMSGGPRKQVAPLSARASRHSALAYGL